MAPFDHSRLDCANAHVPGDAQAAMNFSYLILDYMEHLAHIEADLESQEHAREEASVDKFILLIDTPDAWPIALQYGPQLAIDPTPDATNSNPYLSRVQIAVSHRRQNHQRPQRMDLVREWETEVLWNRTAGHIKFLASLSGSMTAKREAELEDAIDSLHKIFPPNHAQAEAEPTVENQVEEPRASKTSKRKKNSGRRKDSLLDVEDGGAWQSVSAKGKKSNGRQSQLARNQNRKPASEHEHPSLDEDLKRYRKGTKGRSKAKSSGGEQRQHPLTKNAKKNHSRPVSKKQRNAVLFKSRARNVVSYSDVDKDGDAAAGENGTEPEDDADDMDDDEYLDGVDQIDEDEGADYMDDMDVDEHMDILEDMEEN